MRFNVSPIMTLFALSSTEKGESRKFKIYLFSILILFILIVLTCFYMYKCYDVPVHHNRISYLLETHNTHYKKFKIISDVEFVYDYNRTKGMKTLKDGSPFDEKSRIYITSLVIGEKDDSIYNYESTSIPQIVEGDTVDVHAGWVSDGMSRFRGDYEFFNYLRKEGVAPVNENADTIEGTLFFLDINTSNRQYYYPISFKKAKPYRLYDSGGLILSRPSLKRKYLGNDTIWLDHIIGYSKTQKSTINGTPRHQFHYIPPKDSIIFSEFKAQRQGYDKPNPFTTAEDISRAIEVFWFEGDKDSTIELEMASLSVDYIAPTEFSKMVPSPDTIDVSRIVFTDSAKISYIKNNGLRFHVYFPDYENLQEIRIFIVTLLLGGLLGLLMKVIYKIIRIFDTKILNHLSKNKRKYYILAAILFVIIFVIFVCICIHSDVDAYNLYDKRSITIFNM